MKLRFPASIVLALAFAAAAAHAVPATLDHVDPQAPCFRWPAVDMDGDGVFDRIDRCVNTRKGCTVDAYGCAVDEDSDGVCDGLDQCPGTPPGMTVDERGCASSQQIGSGYTPPGNRPTEAPMPAKPTTTGRTSEVERQLIETGTIRLENVYFETASSKLLPESEETLREVGATLEKFPDLRIEIEGHTDTRGWAQYNMRLSQARSEAVRAFLLEHHQLRPNHYVAKGYGETRPETDERNEEELLRNRRVVLRVLNPDVLPRGVEVQRSE
jgi:OmpA-OmpF porin, OOP family